MKNSTDDRLYSSRVLSMDKEAGGGGGRSWGLVEVFGSSDRAHRLRPEWSWREREKVGGRAHASTLCLDGQNKRDEAIVCAVPEVCFLCIYYRAESLEEGIGWMVARPVYIPAGAATGPNKKKKDLSFILRWREGGSAAIIPPASVNRLSSKTRDWERFAFG